MLLFLFLKFLQTNKGILQSNLLLGSPMSQAPLKTVGVDFICFVSSAKLKSCQNHVRDDVAPCSGDMEVKKTGYGIPERQTE